MFRILSNEIRKLCQARGANYIFPLITHMHTPRTHTLTVDGEYAERGTYTYTDMTNIFAPVTT